MKNKLAKNTRFIFIVIGVLALLLGLASQQGSPSQTAGIVVGIILLVVGFVQQVHIKSPFG